MFADNKILRTAIIISVTFHSLLLLIFFFIKVGFNYNISEFTEIAFASGQRSNVKIAPTPPNVQPIESEKSNAEIPSEVVKLPKRQMIDDKEEPLKVANKREKISSEITNVIPQPVKFEKRETLTDESLTKLFFNEKEIALPGEGLAPSDKILPSNSPENISSVGQEMPYEIEGQAAHRAVAYKVIPEYPPNLQRQAVVKISFTVLPDGQIGEMIPRIKANAQLEKITMDALRQWRFSPLPSYKPQTSEKGVITFRYLLK